MTIFRISVTVLAVIHSAFVGLTSLVGAFANGGDVWQRLLRHCRSMKGRPLSGVC